MNDPGDEILRSLRAVAAERLCRRGDAALAARVAAVKRFQQARFRDTYADLLAHPRYARAATFFLDDLYGPSDFTERDDQFARIVPALIRIFPHDIASTVAVLAELHALSERLDTSLARALTGTGINRLGYGQAWRATGQPEARARQLALTMTVGKALEGYTSRALLRRTLRLMRGPAQAAGLGALQRFLEAGFDAFREMRGATTFLDTVESRERAFAAALFDESGFADARMPPGASAQSLGQAL